ncbi:MAG: hypothetical protein A3B23_02760 [Candidatus Colwellbacteria bacterium RIFCSPLOWO2_01_FULL_48_10]|uniref:Rod shape-determining protein RodA n=1 Tax=Candidatus Colwellbacteria bacterium RIFCSPLOWO2_01_FULL_48_10 TaxID=1797690 RepID=A0A1G1Z498_9BACT|nr:MAG: hypothetical protein A3B23_02760 [Candidatus Colwellbacteria bacterium RIFCSPLOWO2_01_FULL_48_10]
MKHYDLQLLGAVGFLMLAGLTNLFSADSVLFHKQLIWVAVAAAAIFILPALNLKAFFSYRWVILGIYLSALFLLVAAYFFAPVVANTKSWLIFGLSGQGGFQIQPSEFVKVALIILFSSFFAVKHVSIKRTGIVIASFVYFILPAALVLIQPDLGTTLILFAIWFGYLLVSEIPIRSLIFMFLLFCVVAAAGWSFGLADYQKDRIIALFNPDYDPLGVNYSVIQSKIAIGSAGLFGKGFRQGTQTQLGFLPEKGNDFAFAAFTEEWGLLGGAALLAVFTFLVYRILVIGLSSDNNFSKLAALGTAIMLLAHFTINVGSNLGLFPVVGVSFPFLSYGGSNLLTTAILIGIIQNTAKRRSGF